MVIDARRACHWTLLRLAGRLPDATLAEARRLLADGRYAATARLLTGELTERGVRLHPDDLRCLRELCDGADLTALGPPRPGDPMPRYRFFPGPPFPGTPADRVDRAAIAAMRGEPGARGLWRSWRAPVRGTATEIRAVFVAEADRGSDPAALAGRLQGRLSAVGETWPQVEAYEVGEWLPAYQRTARAEGELLWSRRPYPGVRIAPLVDGFAGVDGHGWADAEPVEDEDERDRLLRYLDAGVPVLITTARMHDVIDRELGRVVPMSFRTDGTWIWNDINAYYLRTYGLCPDPELVDHIAANGYRMPEVDGVAEFRAVAVLYGSGDDDTARRPGTGTGGEILEPERPDRRPHRAGPDDEG